MNAFEKGCDWGMVMFHEFISIKKTEEFYDEKENEISRWKLWKLTKFHGESWLNFTAKAGNMVKLGESVTKCHVKANQILLWNLVKADKMSRWKPVKVQISIYDIKVVFQKWVKAEKSYVL